MQRALQIVHQAVEHALGAFRVGADQVFQVGQRIEQEMRLHLGLQGAQPGLQGRPLEFLRAPGRLDRQSALAQAFAEQARHRFHRLQRLAGRKE